LVKQISISLLNLILLKNLAYRLNGDFCFQFFIFQMMIIPSKSTRQGKLNTNIALAIPQIPSHFRGRGVGNVANKVILKCL
jgi:hypothetical protein